ncbi:carboxymuconolactone decarboxylase family protein [Enterobacter cloacae]|uniref:Carboxymuconolactone decarboxylase n=1 Tax=Enterobacter cloacae subsp. cloacae TaxID=336306 RepID=A0AAE2ED00_ENTCL|nr:carboxymuconolactone decarboxylase family protein [Enterobacter cloacae]KJM37686.1 carboxymuconolactone decarboxylase [Enterobacter cloacae subsp. cloacae]
MNNGQQSFLMEQQKNIAAIAAQGAAGNIPALNSALQRGLDAGLTINDCREVLVQLYAYAGFPRSLNALTELMSVINTRKAKGIHDVEGQLPGPLPEPEDMLKIGTQNQTALVGQPVKGQLFEFAPAADMYLKTHLFGDIFSRDNLDWLNRELATVGALSAMTGVDPQLKAHITMSINAGLTSSQLKELVRFFGESGEPSMADRLKKAMENL